MFVDSADKWFGPARFAGVSQIKCHLQMQKEGANKMKFKERP
jgi:hypothetical protein